MSAGPDKSYAICNTCDLDLPTPEVAQQHTRETMARVEGEGSIIARSHGYTVMNPTPLERKARLVKEAIGYATDYFCEDMDNALARGELTAEEVTQALRGHPDFADAWQEWPEEQEEYP